MRSCVFCGKELEKGEVCMCPQSVERRAKKNHTEENNARANTSQSAGSNFKAEQAERTTYKTGYTAPQGKFKRAWNRHKARQKSRESINPGGFFRELLSFVKAFIKSPIDKIINPPNIGKASMLTIAAIQGAVTWLSLYFVYTGINRSVFSILGSVLGFAGMQGYSSIIKLLICIVLGAVSGVTLFFIYTGIFYFINKFVLKNDVKYWDFAVRLSLTGIPLTVLGLIGVLCSFFSLTTLAILILCGLISLVVLTYEALRTEWINKSPGTVMYSMMAGFFVFLTVICYLIRIS